MTLRAIDYEASGRPYTGFLADGSGGAPAPGVLVIHEAGGLGAHVKDIAERLAELGLIAFAMDLFGADFPAPVPERPETLAPAQAVVRALREDVGEFRARVTAGLAVLAGQPNVDGERLAAIGYCLGGAAAIELARTGAPLKAVAGFHAGVLAGSVEDNERIRAKILLCHGADDGAVPAADILAFTQALSVARVDWQLHLYGNVGHSFTNPAIDAWGFAGFGYDAKADARAWAALMELFGEAFEGR
jgi:dienelactone hydrolase